MHNILHCVCDPYLSPFLPAAQCKKHESSALYKYKAPRVPPWLSQCGNTGLARPLTRSVLRLTDPPSVGRSDGWSVARGGCVRGRQETIIVFAVFAAAAAGVKVRERRNFAKQTRHSSGKSCGGKDGHGEDLTTHELSAQKLLFHAVLSH